mgnify:CR=1 FL=1|tara:strand:- start:1934 stop:2296 length:363 start_codon:yes stop_codon:yes gene_type:complete
MSPKKNICFRNSIFQTGKNLFNEGKIHDAHLIWEKIWKDGDENSRKKIKGFIQLSGALLNNEYGKRHAAEYLLKKANENISQLNDEEFSIDIKNVVMQIRKYSLLIHDDICCCQNIPIKL